jgi:hypothetical protein
MLKFTNYRFKYTPDQHTNNNNNNDDDNDDDNNNNKGLYMQPQTHCLHKIL